MTFSRPTVAEVDLAALRHNVAAVRACIGDRVRILAVVKADGYGHGAVPSARACLAAGAEELGVATVDEGVELREAGIDAPILILGATLPDESEAIVAHQLTPTVVTLEVAQALARAGARRAAIANVHVKIDTGMGRLGVWHEESLVFIEELTRCAGILVSGIWTHFATAETADKSFTREQLRIFDEIVIALRHRGLRFTAHAANSAALIDVPESRHDLVRPGIVLYGAHPSAHTGRLDLRPTMTLRSRVTFLKRVPAGRSLSYGRTYTTTKPTVIATAPVGYVDGCLRAASNCGHALVRGERCPIVGRVCMDQCLLDVGALPEVAVGDEVVFFGRAQNGACLTVESVARTMNTIPHEVLCSVGKRVPRVYVE